MKKSKKLAAIFGADFKMQEVKHGNVLWFAVNLISHLSFFNLMNTSNTHRSVTQDPNAEARGIIMKNGYQLPALGLTPQEFHALEVNDMYEEHKRMPDLFNTKFDASVGKSEADSNINLGVLEKHSFLNLLVEIKQGLYHVGDPTELYITLYSEDRKQFLR